MADEGEPADATASAGQMAPDDGDGILIAETSVTARLAHRASIEVLPGHMGSAFGHQQSVRMRLRAHGAKVGEPFRLRGCLSV